MIYAIVGMLANACEQVFDKVILKTKNITYKQFLPISMLVLFLIGLFAFPLLGRVDPDFFSAKYLTLFGFEIFVAFFYNIFFFYSLKKEDLCDVTPFVLLDKPVMVIMAALIFPAERNLLPLVFTLVAATALLMSRIKKHHFSFKFKRTTLALLSFVVLISIEAQLAKILLEVMSPVAFYCFRTGLLALAFWIVFRPKLKHISSNGKVNITIDSFITYIEYVFRFYAIMYLGIVQSTLLLLLAPVITLSFSKFFLKENFTFRKAVADVIIIACVAATILAR